MRGLRDGQSLTPFSHKSGGKNLSLILGKTLSPWVPDSKKPSKRRTLLGQVGDRRLGDHLLAGLEALLPYLYPLVDEGDRAALLGSFSESRVMDGEVSRHFLPVGWATRGRHTLSTLD